MKASHVLPLVALSSALVLPPEEVLRQVQYEEHQRGNWYEDLASEKDRLLRGGQESIEDLHELYQEAAVAVEEAREKLNGVPEWLTNEWDALGKEAHDVWVPEAKDKSEDAVEWITEKSSGVMDDVEAKVEELRQEWDLDAFDTPVDGDFSLDDLVEEDFSELEGGHHGHHGDHGHHGHHGRHGHHGSTSNYTVYQLIAHSEYSTTLSKLIGKYPDIVERLNSTKHNYTVFAPTDKAFSRIPEKVLDKLSKKEVNALLDYHIVPGLYPARRLLFTQTAPTYLMSDHLADSPRHQRLTFSKGLRGISVDFYSRIVAANIYGSNGIVHGVDSPILPPIGGIEEISLFPGTFSTLELALAKADLLEELNSTDHDGGTLFAPNNWAFQKLGPRVNAFLFSPAGNKYLKALLLYHIVPDNTLYSDAYYHPHDDDDEARKDDIHVDLPTALEGRNLAVDVSRWGPIVTVKVNGFNRVSVPDVVAEDGVIHVMNSVIIPPKTPRGAEEAGKENEELTVEELMERLGPYVADKPEKEDL